MRFSLALLLSLFCSSAFAQVTPGTSPLSIAKGGTNAGTPSTAFANLVQPSGATTLGGVKSLTCSTSNWFNTLSTSGVFGCAQPNFTDLAGSLAVGQIPANLITNAKLATMAANTVKANATGGAATPTDVAPAAARSSSLLNVDSFTGVGNTAYSILTTDRTVGTNAAFTASRTWTLPAANAVNPGQEIIVADYQGTVTGTNTLVVSRAGADTVNGGTAVTITAANGAYLLKSDGVSKWTAQALGSAAAGGVSSVTCGTGLSGGTITTSGTCAIAQPYFNANLSAAQTVTTSTPTKVQFNTKVLDSNTWYDNVTNFRFTPLLAGKYRVHANIECTGTTVSFCETFILKNGVAIAESLNVGAGQAFAGSSVDVIVTVNGTSDFLEAQGEVICTGTCQIGGGTVPIFSWFEAQYVSP